MKILIVANKILPPNDYRIQYAIHERKLKVLVGVPGEIRIIPKDRTVYLPFEEGLSLKDFRAFAMLFAYLYNNRNELSLVHYFSTKLVLIGPILSYLLGIPSLITITGFGRVFSGHRFIYVFLRVVYTHLLRNAVSLSSLCLFQNRSDLETAIYNLRLPKEKLSYIGSSVEAWNFEQKDYDSRPLVILNVCRLIPGKGVDDFLTIAKILHGNSFRFVLVGPSSDGHQSLLQKVLRNAESGIIEYKGELAGEELKACYQESHTLLFPSSYGEGLSRVMLEAGFSGLCPLAYDINANLDLVDKGRGFLVPKNDIRSLVKILRNLSSNRALLRENALAYRSHISSNYSFINYYQRIENVISKIIEKNSG